MLLLLEVCVNFFFATQHALIPPSSLPLSLIIDDLQPGYSLRTFTGHSAAVMSLDFHPSNDDFICSCDDSEIRYWSVKNGSCTGIFKV